MDIVLAITEINLFFMMVGPQTKNDFSNYYYFSLKNRGRGGKESRVKTRSKMMVALKWILFWQLQK